VKFNGYSRKLSDGADKIQNSETVAPHLQTNY